MQEITSASVKKLKKKLESYERGHLKFNEPHFTQMLLLRDGDKRQVIQNLLNPENLMYFYTEKGKYGDVKYSLYFKISHNKTMKLPLIFDLNNKKCIYILTYIMRDRPWHTMIKRLR